MTAPIPLNPADHFLLTMDREIRKAGLPGAWCAIALELAGEPDIAALEAGLAELGRHFPALDARLVSRGRRFAWQPQGGGIPLHTRCWDGDLSAVLADLLNDAGDAFASPPLDCHCLTAPERTLLVVRWLHPLLDAGGVKRLLDYLAAEPQTRDRYHGRETALVLQKLRGWSWLRRLKLLWRGKRHNDWIDRLASSQPARATAGPRRLRHTVLLLDRDETKAVLESARRRVGLGGQTLYLIGCLMRALEATGPAERCDAWCIPYAFDLRPGNAPAPVTGNQVAALFAQAGHAATADRDALFRHLRAQHEDAIRRELDQAYLPLMWLGQWLSLERYAEILRRQKSGGERASAWFSDVGEIRLRRPDFLGPPVTGVHHACQVTAPPSLAVLFARFDGRLQAAINHLVPDLDEDWAARFRRYLHDELLSG
ncbi:hypothetical protein MIN45_P2252 [Methylomarinovum tepidoasis]|uniref:Condensation domain-containing protein n=1 Tax=Methylomarinovum tepidoasis TaxID=2840183 RepID=A0AAU9C1P1_9GAMM|nr:hypothetical protein [Methylomarinovum sp. IN45]BCX89878.1 hypothetical protein MIN45_P2252 [Methylomarinovum sp. IN45]